MKTHLDRYSVVLQKINGARYVLVRLVKRERPDMLRLSESAHSAHKAHRPKTLQRTDAS